MNIEFAELIERGTGGVFRCHSRLPTEMVQAAIKRGIHPVTIDLAGARDKTAFLNVVANALVFPDYFGHNWDAFYDCLLELENQQEKGTLLWLREASGFARAEPEEFAAAIGAMRDAVEYWDDKGKILLVATELEAPVLAPELTELRS